MKIEVLYLKNFRNYREARFSFSSGVNFIHGDNATGKTTLLEALSLLSTGRSFRTHHLEELILSGAPYFYIEAKVEKNGISHKISLFFDGKIKKLKIDASEYNSFSPLIGLLPAIFYLPQDEEMISGPPGLRRRFFNLHLVQSDPLYMQHLSRFWRAMKARNCLLRLKKEEAIDCFEEEMALSASYLFVKREAFLEELKLPLQGYSQELTENQELYEIEWRPSYPKQQEKYQELLKTSRKKEKEVGSTFFGPHRDDLSFLISKKEAKLFASMGQKKSLATALRWSEWQRLSDQIGHLAWMAIDDLGPPLDRKRLSLFAHSLKNLGQIFITATEKMDPFSSAHFISSNEYRPLLEDSPQL